MLECQLSCSSKAFKLIESVKRRLQMVFEPVSAADLLKYILYCNRICLHHRVGVCSNDVDTVMMLDEVGSGDDFPRLVKWNLR